MRFVVDAIARSVIAVSAVFLLAACPPPSSLPTVLPTGTTPNAVAAITCADGPRLLVAASAEARLDVLDPAGVAPPRSIFLGAGSAPWDVAVMRDSVSNEEARALVTLNGSHALALVAPCGEAPALLDTLADDEPFVLPTPVTLREADDVDGDGVAELEVTRMIPRSPQAVVVGGDQAFVAFANVLAFATSSEAPMLTGPGLVSRVVIDGDTLRVVGRGVLPCDNAGGLAVIDDVTATTSVAASCAGRFAVGDGGHEKAGPGGLAVIATATMTVTVATTTTTTPGPLTLADGALLSGDLLDGGLRQHGLADLALHDTVAGRTDVIDSAFALAVDRAGVVVAGWFDGRVSRDPFGADRVTPPPAGPLRGLVDLVDDGERLWGLHSLSAELVVIPEAP